MKLTILLCVLVCYNTVSAQIDKKTITKLEDTAKKIRTANIFMSDAAIKKRIRLSMSRDEQKWKQAREDYQSVLRHLREMQIEVNVPNTLDELLIERDPEDANKILMYLARQAKHINS